VGVEERSIKGVCNSRSGAELGRSLQGTSCASSKTLADTRHEVRNARDAQGNPMPSFGDYLKQAESCIHRAKTEDDPANRACLVALAKEFLKRAGDPESEIEQTTSTNAIGGVEWDS
jgi:predicted amidophosphoribosyltransferase